MDVNELAKLLQQPGIKSLLRKMIAEEVYQPIGAVPSLIRKDFGLILQESKNAAVPMPLASLVHDRLTALVAKDREDRDWAGFAEEISDSAGLKPGSSG